MVCRANGDNVQSVQLALLIATVRFVGRSGQLIDFQLPLVFPEEHHLTAFFLAEDLALVLPRD